MKREILILLVVGGLAGVLLIPTVASPFGEDDNVDPLTEIDHLEIVPSDSPNSVYAVLRETDQGKEIELNLTKENQQLAGEGINEDSVTYIDDIFLIMHTGDDNEFDYPVWIEIEDANGDTIESVTFYKDEFETLDSVIEGEKNNVTMGPGEIVSVGMRVDTTDPDHDVTDAETFIVNSKVPDDGDDAPDDDPDDGVGDDPDDVPPEEGDDSDDMPDDNGDDAPDDNGDDAPDDGPADDDGDDMPDDGPADDNGDDAPDDDPDDGDGNGEGDAEGPELEVEPEAIDIDDTSARLRGGLTRLEGFDEAEVWFEWRVEGDDEWDETGTQTMTTVGSFSEVIDGLESETTYEFRVVGEANETRALSEVMSFSTGVDPAGTGELGEEPTEADDGDGLFGTDGPDEVLGGFISSTLLLLLLAIIVGVALFALIRYYSD